jgi:hypothetical protein
MAGFNEQTCLARHSALGWGIGVLITTMLLTAAVAAHAYNKSADLSNITTSHEVKIDKLEVKTIEHDTRLSDMQKIELENNKILKILEKQANDRAVGAPAPASSSK